MMSMIDQLPVVGAAIAAFAFMAVLIAVSVEDAIKN